MTEDEAIDLFGVPAADSALPEIRNLLRSETEKERQCQGQGDTLLMKLLCVILFLHGHPEDILDIWRAKTASMDADASIDIQLLCGAGVNTTLTFLKNAADRDANEAFTRIEKCLASGDFSDFSPERFGLFWLDYYRKDQNLRR